jgi:hypothetical protein
LIFFPRPKTFNARSRQPKRVSNFTDEIPFQQNLKIGAGAGIQIFLNNSDAGIDRQNFENRISKRIRINGDQNFLNNQIILHVI